MKNISAGSAPGSRPGFLTASYWRAAAGMLKDTRVLVFAALICALRVAVKAINIPLAANLELSLDCYVNSLGSIVYGPVTALLVGAVSDTLGCILFPSGAYFFPFIFVEMSSGFIFALFFWNRRITVTRSLVAKFTVNFVCNILLTSLIMKWQYAVLYGSEKTYNLVNLVRICKNLILFPLEGMLIAVVFERMLPILSRFGFKAVWDGQFRLEKKHRVLLLLLLLLAVALILLYIFVLKDLISANNIKLL